MIKQHARNLSWSLYKKQFTIFWKPLQYAVVGFPRVDNEAAPLRGGQVFSCLHCTACIRDASVDAPPPGDSPNIKSFAGNFKQLPVARQLDLSQREDRAERQGNVRCRKDVALCFRDCVYLGSDLVNDIPQFWRKCGILAAVRTTPSPRPVPGPHTCVTFLHTDHSVFTTWP